MRLALSALAAHGLTPMVPAVLRRGKKYIAIMDPPEIPENPGTNRFWGLIGTGAPFSMQIYKSVSATGSVHNLSVCY